jgi:hypothetical protein
MSCGDPYLKELRARGYNVVRLPKADIRPLQLLAKRGDALDRIGELGTVLPAGSIAPPPLKEDTPVASLSGVHSGELSLGVGLSILGTIIGAMGGSKLGLDVAYKNAKSVTFEFLDVLEDRVEVARLDQYLAAADVSPFSSYVAKMLDADQLHVTTATIKSNRISVESKGTGATGVDVSVPEIKGVVGGNVKVGGGSDKTSKVTFEGTVPLVFGFQAVRLFYEKGRYQRFEVLGGGAVLEKVPAPEAVGTELLGRGPFVRVLDV